MQFAFAEVEDKIKVDVALACGRRFYGFANIHEPYAQSPSSPILQLNGPVGFLAIAQLMDQWLEVRDEFRSNRLV